ncbi:MAG TPA: transglycosylase domain-containing protein [Verrucomicrobiales bacterium]|nr:transglycosylase domain-containing protein [Verrucomicrobiales bacterium]
MEKAYTWNRVRRKAPRRKPDSGWKSRAGRFKAILLTLVVLAVAGLVAIPITLAPFKRTAETFDLREIARLEEASIIYDRYDQDINRIFVENRLPIKLEEVPEHLVRALIAVEDSRFYRHNGVDFVGIIRAVLLNLQARRVTQGASTITQQLARQSFELKEHSIQRKLVEAFLARRIEDHYSKDEILEHYLNRIFFGHEFFGVQAAAIAYFGKPVSELDLAESAMLCGLIKSPNNISPLRNPDRAKRERNYVLDRMQEEGMIDQAECRRIQAEPVRINPQPLSPRSSYVYDLIRQQVFALIGSERARAGGFRIYTTVDDDLQSVAQDSLRRQLGKVEEHPGFNHITYTQYAAQRKAALESGAQPELPSYLQGAALAVENQTGAILALVGGRDFVHSQYNRALQARRPPGTAFTPFVFATAFERGFYPGTLLRDDFIDNTQVMIGAEAGILGEWGSETADARFLGNIPARQALVLSKNAATVRLGFQVGVPAVAEVAKRAGIDSDLGEYPKMFLGESEVSMAELCKAYTVFPNGGSRPTDLHIINRIETKDGLAIYQVPPRMVQHVEALDVFASFQTHSCLHEALRSGTGKPAWDMGLQDIPDLAGKTGTSYEFKDAWFAGYDSRVTCAVWMGFDQPKSIYRGAFSTQTALPVWIDIMNASRERFPAAALQVPNQLKAVEICTVSGQVATDACYEKRAPSPQDPTPRYVRTTYVEYVRRGTALAGSCATHGSEWGSDLLNPLQAGMVAAEGGIIPNTTPPIYVQAESILGADPYQSVTPPSPRAEIAKVDGEDDAPIEVKGVKPRIVFPTGIGDDSNSRLAIPPPPPLELE